MYLRYLRLRCVIIINSMNYLINVSMMWFKLIMCVLYRRWSNYNIAVSVNLRNAQINLNYRTEIYFDPIFCSANSMILSSIRKGFLFMKYACKDFKNTFYIERRNAFSPFLFLHSRELSSILHTWDLCCVFSLILEGDAYCSVFLS